MSHIWLILIKAGIFKGLFPTVLLQSASSICHKVNGNKKKTCSVSSSNGLYVIRYYYTKHDAMIHFRRRCGKTARIFSSVLSEMSGQIPYTSILTYGKKSGIFEEKSGPSPQIVWIWLGRNITVNETRIELRASRQSFHYNSRTRPILHYVISQTKQTNYTTHMPCIFNNTPEIPWQATV